MSRPGPGWTPTPRLWVVGAVVFAVLISALDVSVGRHSEFVGLLVAPPFLAAVFAPYRYVLTVGVVSTVLATGLGIHNGEGASAAQLMRLTVIIAGTLLAAVLAELRERASARVASLSKLAAVAQQAVLRPIGSKVGDLSVAVRYVSASQGADIGGDLYEAVDTAYGVRLLVGDVRGKGLDAVRLASTVLGSYRHVAHERADPRAIITDLDRAVARSVETEDFVTVCLLEERGGTLTVLNCGHPPPLLLRQGQVIPLEPPASAPPLGFMPVATPRVERLEPGDRVLVFTDGLAEARNEGEFFPLTERSWRILGHGTVEDGLTSLESALSSWVHGRLEDDIAMVLFEYSGGVGAQVPRAQSPAWEWNAAQAR